MTGFRPTAGCVRVLALLALCLALRTYGGQDNFVPGQSYFGRSNYVEYLAGDMPLIISAPHGGLLKPAEVPNRKQGTFDTDTNTELLARAIYQAFHERLGGYPHVVICRLVRTKVDCNRDMIEGAGENANAKQAWRDFQQFIEVAKTNVLASPGRGFYIDLHGQSHPIKRIELGYSLSASQLTNSNPVLNGPSFAERSTIRTLARRSGLPLSELLRGTNSLGAMLAAKGYPAVPSPAMPDPGAGNPFFGGGPNARRHGSSNGGTIDGVQIEVNLEGIRDTGRNRVKFALALAEVMESFFRRYYAMELGDGAATGSR